MASICGQALAGSLQSGAAPELILLDLRENPFGSDAISDLVGFEKGCHHFGTYLPRLLLTCKCPCRKLCRNSEGSSK